jgi:dipeptidyl-peptidase-3
MLGISSISAGPDVLDAPARSPQVERVGDRAFLQVGSPSFSRLELRQKIVALHLTRAAIQMDPIFYDQMASYGLDLKRLMGALAESPDRLPKDTRSKLLDYARLVFACKGNHNEATSRKFLPDFTFEQLVQAAQYARIRGARLKAKVALDALLQRLRRPIFDPSFEPMVTEKNPPEGQDILTASSNNYYEGVRLSDLSRFPEKHPLNSRVSRRGGTLVEEVYRAGTPDGRVPPGRYARELRAANAELENAIGFAEPSQAAVLRALIRYYETGEPGDWNDFNVLWVRDRSAVEFVSGFIEVYHDARGAKGSAQMLVSVVDRNLDSLMHRLAESAVEFEKKAPWDDAYKKLDVKPPVGRAIETLVETGDFLVGTVGDSLPNEQAFREKYGTKNLLLTSSVAAFNALRGARVAEAFSPDSSERESFEKYGSAAGNLLVAMHEILGHGSGKVSVAGDPRTYLREYYSTLEEARADLVALWNVVDPQLADLGMRDVAEVGRELYRQYARVGLTTLKNYPEGDSATEDHDRNRLLIVNWVIDHGGFERIRRENRSYIVVKDDARVREAVGELLREVMRIKAQGDYEAGKALVLRYGVHFDPVLRDEVVARYRALDLAPYSTGIYPELQPVFDPAGKIVDVEIASTRDFLKQQVEFAKANGTLGF